jgi:ABC-type cobalamin/Fe3+-siderophores transport system ATPase subunit
MKIKISIDYVQHIKHMEVVLDFEKNNIACIVSKNGIGKTTLLKSLSFLYNPSVLKKQVLMAF